MKLVSVQTARGVRLAARSSEGICIFSELPQHRSSSEAEAIPETLDEALCGEGGLDAILPRLQALLSHARSLGRFVREEEVRPERLLHPGKIICVGLNYRDHVSESQSALPGQPVIFAKWRSAVIASRAPIVLPPDSREVDYEAELAVVMGRECRHVSAGDALEYVAGYTCMNDVSARDFQRSDGQWTRAKSQDSFAPIGPCLVTRDEIPDPQNLAISCRVRDRLMQNSSTSQMIFGVRELIAFISRGITLFPGDVISTGTPEGVGFAQQPPVFLRHGDEVIVEIEGIGQLANPVVDATIPAAIDRVQVSG